MGLTLKQYAFCKYYLQTGNGTRAAELAGYRGNDNGLAATASRNLRTPAIKEVIDKEVEQLQFNPKPRHQLDHHQLDSVYMIQEGFMGLVKIGFSRSPHERLRTLQCACPQTLRLLATLETSEARRCEADLQDRFKKKLYHGEWHELTDEDIQSVIDEWSMDDLFARLDRVEAIFNRAEQGCR